MDELQDQIRNLEAETRKALAEAASPGDLDKIEREVLGRQGSLRGLFKSVTMLPPDRRGQAGTAVNRLKKTLEDALAERRKSIATPEAGAAPRIPGFDLTLPGRPPRLGGRHPIYATLDSILRVFEKLGFNVARGPEIETEWHNFEALNIPLEHPAHDQWDTYYLDAEHLLRSHTSPVQIRTMQRMQPPLRIVAPGRVFRPDTVDASHAQMFHQVEGLMVGGQVSFADLKGVLTIFVREYFGPETEMRLRPSFFPFTEPSAEVDISCFLCGGTGCPACKQRGWMEILGAGMVHPRVFESVGYDPAATSGFAFGMGVERIAMLRHGIRDIRLFTENHARFLEQFT